MGTIKTCDRCGEIIDNKDVYLSGWFDSTSEDKGTNGDISDGFDLCQECYYDFKHSYLKYFAMISLEEEKDAPTIIDADKDITDSSPITGDDIWEWQKDKIKEILNANNKKEEKDADSN